MGRRLLTRTLPVGDWQTNLARFCFAADAGCRFARGRLHGNVPPCCRSIARDAVLGQAKNRSPVHLFARFKTRPHEMFRLSGPLGCLRGRISNSIINELLGFNHVLRRQRQTAADF
jgi:hypothetical protein